MTVTRPPRAIGEVETCREYLTADAFPPERLGRYAAAAVAAAAAERLFLPPQVPLGPGWWWGCGMGRSGGGGGFPMNLLTWFLLLPTGSRKSSEMDSGGGGFEM